MKVIICKDALLRKKVNNDGFYFLDVLIIINQMFERRAKVAHLNLLMCL